MMSNSGALGRRSVLKLLSRSRRTNTQFLTSASYPSTNNHIYDDGLYRVRADRPLSLRGWTPRQRCPSYYLTESAFAAGDSRWFSSHSEVSVSSPLEAYVDEEDNNGDDNESTQGLRFEDLEPALHPKTLEALTRQGITTLTDIQAQTWEAASQGHDVLGRSRTGSGKTLAFLLPAMERILREENKDDRIPILVISPTRELAHQIHSTAEKLLQSHQKPKQDRHHRHAHSSGPCSVVMYGGTSKGFDIKSLDEPRRTPLPTVLTATPGRLLDHLQNSVLRNRQCNVSDLVANTQVLILDEMDRLLDMGFQEDIRRILRYLPSKENRQTLLFSATLPPDVKREIDTCIRRNHVHVDCIQGDHMQETVNTVQQSHVVLPPDQLIVGVVQALRYFMETSESDCKMMVFFNTTSQVQYFAELLRTVVGHDISVYELHSKKNQSSRSNTSDKFRKAKRAILCTSDVSARGVDYPRVTHVVQVGSAADRETYIHRLGRTARAGKTGQGILLLLPIERKAGVVKKDYTGIDIPVHQELQELLKNDASVSETSVDLQDAMKLLHHKACDCYRSLLGFYAQHFKKMNVKQPLEKVIQLINDFADQAQLHERPHISAKVAVMYGLMKHPDIKIDRERGDSHHEGRGRSGSVGGGRERSGSAYGGRERIGSAYGGRERSGSAYGGRGKSGNDQGGRGRSGSADGERSRYTKVDGARSSSFDGGREGSFEGRYDSRAKKNAETGGRHSGHSHGKKSHSASRFFASR